MTIRRLEELNRAVDWSYRHLCGETMREIAESVGLTQQQIKNTLLWAATNDKVMSGVTKRAAAVKARNVRMMSEVDN